MKFFLDTANISEIKDAAELGVVDGVTTNPSLVAKEGRELRDVVADIVKIVDGPISAEVVSLDAPTMIKEGRGLSAIHPNVVVKLPLIREGLKAAKVLSQEGIRTNVTLCFSPGQALLAAKAGASYVSPFVGRLDDVSHDGMEVVEKIITILDNYDFPTEVIVSSCRGVQHVIDAALMGADVATMPKKVFDQLVKHPLTDIGLELFLADYKKQLAEGKAKR